RQVAPGLETCASAGACSELVLRRALGALPRPRVPRVHALSLVPVSEGRWKPRAPRRRAHSVPLPVPNETLVVRRRSFVERLGRRPRSAIQEGSPSRCQWCCRCCLAAFSLDPPGFRCCDDLETKVPIALIIRLPLAIRHGNDEARCLRRARAN